MKKEINVAVVSANYNNEFYLETYLDSIINSSVIPKEIIIVDDCSTDNSLSILDKYENDRIKVVRLNKNLGFANALNIGVTMVKSKYVIRLDPDDYIDQYRLQKQYEFMEMNPSVDMLSSNCYYVNQAGDELILKTNLPTEHNEIEKRIKAGMHAMVHGSLICKTQILKKYQYRQEAVPAEEYDLFARIMKDGYKFHNLKDPLTYVRIHEKSVSNKMPFSTVKKTYDINTKIFNKKNTSVKILLQYGHIHFYRKALFQKNKTKRLFILLLSAFFKPNRIFLRIKDREN